MVISGTTGIDVGSLPIANAGKISAGTGLPAVLNTAGVDRVTVDINGNVGIGTNSPAQKLEVQDGSIQVYNSTSSALGASQPFGLKFRATNQIGQDRGTIAFIKTYLGNALDNDFGLIFQTQSTTAEGLTTKVVIDTKGSLLLTSGTGGLGYGTGSGGTVTQLTSKSTDVTLNKPTGQIIMNNAALAAGATVSFRFFNSVYTNSYDLIYFQLLNNANSDKYNIWAVNNGPGFAFVIYVKNISASSLSEILTINFALIKGATA